MVCAMMNDTNFVQKRPSKIVFLYKKQLSKVFF